MDLRSIINSDAPVTGRSPDLPTPGTASTPRTNSFADRPENRRTTDPPPAHAAPYSSQQILARGPPIYTAIQQKHADYVRPRSPLSATSQPIRSGSPPPGSATSQSPYLRYTEIGHPQSSQQSPITSHRDGIVVGHTSRPSLRALTHHPPSHSFPLSSSSTTSQHMPLNQAYTYQNHPSQSSTPLSALPPNSYHQPESHPASSYIYPINVPPTAPISHVAHSSPSMGIPEYPTSAPNHGIRRSSQNHGHNRSTSNPLAVAARPSPGPGPYTSHPLAMQSPPGRPPAEVRRVPMMLDGQSRDRSMSVSPKTNLQGLQHAYEHRPYARNAAIPAMSPHTSSHGSATSERHMDFPSIKSLHGGVVALPDRVMPSQPHFSHSPSYDSRESQHVYHPAQPYAPHPGAAPLGAAANSPSSHDIPSQTFIHPPAKPFARTQRSFDSGAPGNGVFMAHHSDRIEGPLHEAMTAHHPPNDLTESMGNEARPLHVPPGLSRELAPGKRVVDESMQKSHQTQTQVSPLMSVERPPPGSVDSGTIPRPKRHAHGPPAWAIRAAPQRIVCVKRDGRASMDPSISRALDGDGSSKQVGRPSPTIVPRLTNGHPESSWDCSITGDRPYDEVTRELCDFLHAFVVANDGWRSLEGVKLEIEAKIGMLFDDVTKTRLALPVRTETVVDRAAVDVRFKSSITLEHHKTMNLFLNDAFNRSQASGRSPMTYKHTKERDSFYDFVPEKHFQYLPACAQNILPASAAANQGRPPRIRLTRDENGKELHKIIKHRVEDLDIFSPRTEFDYRISINLEFPFEGDTSLLVDSYEHGKPKKGRSKDRVTYWHQSYRLDFTQAKASEDQSANAHDCSHELEIELDEEKLYMAGKNDRPAFEQYVEGLVNNLRVLGRVGRDIPGGVS